MKSEIREIKRIRILTLAKIFALIGLLSGLLTGIQAGMQSTVSPLAFADAASYAQQDPSLAPLAFLVAFGWWAVIIAPIVFAIVQFVMGLIIGLIYNLFAKFVGGVKIELE